MSIALQNRMKTLEARLGELEARIYVLEKAQKPAEPVRPTLTLPAKNEQRRTALASS
jgi:BMFP domain-containing protein YqiC